MNKVICHYCNNKAMLVTGEVIYPHRKDLANRNFYLCVPCNAYVGTHKHTTIPLGILANAELRRAKGMAHAAFDPIWRNLKVMQRKQAYLWLAMQLGIKTNECHIGMFNIEMCKKVIAIANNYKQSI